MRAVRRFVLLQCHQGQVTMPRLVSQLRAIGIVISKRQVVRLLNADTGPFEYVPRSAPGGELDRLWPWRPLGENYPPEDEFAESGLAERDPAAASRAVQALDELELLAQMGQLTQSLHTTA